MRAGARRSAECSTCRRARNASSLKFGAHIRGFVGRRVRKPADVDDIVEVDGARPEPNPQAF